MGRGIIIAVYVNELTSKKEKKLRKKAKTIGGGGNWRSADAAPGYFNINSNNIYFYSYYLC